VHLPLGLAVVWPLACVAVFVAVRAGWLPLRAWWGVVALAALLAGGALLAVETGEEEEERVERVVSHDEIHEHAEAGEWVLWLAAAGLAASLGGLLPHARVARSARLVTLGVSLVVLAAAVRAGHLGGRLVYEHGAASAYVEAEAGAPAPASTP
jgi:hypothetical protein